MDGQKCWDFRNPIYLNREALCYVEANGNDYGFHSNIRNLFANTIRSSRVMVSVAPYVGNEAGKVN